MLLPVVFAMLFYFSALLQFGYALKCRALYTTENATANELIKQQTNPGNFKCTRNEKNCGVTFCSAGTLEFNTWECNKYSELEQCAKGSNTSYVNEKRRGWHLSEAKEWKCKCHFGANGVDLANADFMPSSAGSINGTNQRNIGMLLLAMMPYLLGFLSY
ncbi:hypothetical protein niasHS_001983 [Heterodera schachtii]|uniref:Uncharacterized protein n=1 Tax=Heterodera schachtii TaxID=97005 RepID=A0ABD2K5I6_HETSC